MGIGNSRECVGVAPVAAIQPSRRAYPIAYTATGTSINSKGDGNADEATTPPTPSQHQQHQLREWGQGDTGAGVGADSIVEDESPQVVEEVLPPENAAKEDGPSRSFARLTSFRRFEAITRVLLVASLLSLMGNLGILVTSLAAQLREGNSEGAWLVLLAQLLAALIFLCLFGHRLLAYLGGLLLRRWLRNSASNNGFFDIHVGWVSLRGPLDHTQLVLHDVLWENHPSFRRTPYLLHASELSVSLCLVDLPALLRLRAVKLQDVVVDSLEVFFERADMMITTASTSERQLERDYLNVWAALGVCDGSAAREGVRTVVGALFHLIMEKLAEKMVHRPMHSLLHGAKPFRKYEHPPLTVELRRLFVLDLVVHPLQLLSGCSAQSSGMADMIHIPLMFLTHKELGGKNGQALPADEFGDRFGEAFAAVLFANNAASIVALLTASAGKKTINAAARFFRRDRSK